MTDAATTVCCPEFDPRAYDGKTHVWKNKPFLRDDVPQLFHIPLTMGRVVSRMWRKVEAAGAAPPTPEFLLLCCDPSPWKSELYLSVTKPVPDCRMASLSGTFISNVYEGPYQAVPAWLHRMDAYLSARGKSALKYYIHYAYCPACAKKYGHNYGVVFAQVS